jgi:mannose-6-phosphate isomerase-like protein (cupin superfamily)
MNKPYLVKNSNKIEPVICSCGLSVRPITCQDTSIANLHITHIKNSRKHYHKNCTEFYYIIEGKGKMQLGNREIDLYPGITIMINRGITHRGYGDFKAVIFGVPAIEYDDEFFVE